MRRARTTFDEARLYDYAVGALGRRMRTVAELKRLMRQRLMGQPGSDELMDAVIRRLKEHQYLNDSNFAAAYSNFRRDNEKFGRGRVATDLKAKGVHSDVIEKALAGAYEGVDEEQLARQHLARKRIKKPATQKEAARVFRALARAGFRPGVIIAILKKWDVEDELLSALESEP